MKHDLTLPWFAPETFNGFVDRREAFDLYVAAIRRGFLDAVQIYLAVRFDDENDDPGVVLESCIELHLIETWLASTRVRESLKSKVGAEAWIAALKAIEQPEFPLAGTRNLPVSKAMQDFWIKVLRASEASARAKLTNRPGAIAWIAGQLSRVGDFDAEGWVQDLRDHADDLTTWQEERVDLRDFHQQALAITEGFDRWTSRLFARLQQEDGRRIAPLSCLEGQSVVIRDSGKPVNVSASQWKVLKVLVDRFEKNLEGLPAASGKNRVLCLRSESGVDDPRKALERLPQSIKHFVHTPGKRGAGGYMLKNG